MSSPRIPDLSWLQLSFNSEFFYEKRMENDVNGNPIYVGYARAGAAASDDSWYITKQTYDGNQSVTRQQVASDAPAFNYVWDDRATYF